MLSKPSFRRKNPYEIESCLLEPSLWKQPKNVGYLAIILGLCVLSIMAYGTYRCRTPGFEDPLTQCVVGNDSRWSQFLDGWGMLHFWFFAMLAFYYPNCWKEILVAGILWEVIEMMFNKRPFYLAKCDASIDSNKEGWWYGRWEDIVTNSFGMVFGLVLIHYGVTGKVFPIGFVVIILFHFMLQSVRVK